MENIFVEFLPPWVETGIQPAFYDKESGTVLQQTARMYARVNMLIRMFNKLSKQTKETVEDYINRFNELAQYVHDYFDNLDVQEEINNKLDAMAEAGTLADIIADYIQLKGILAYDTVADLKNATNIVDGSFAETYGFHTKGDGGSAKYKIRYVTNDDVVDERTIIEITSDPQNNLIAELILTKDMTVDQFGAYGDDTHDDIDAFDTMMTKAGYIATQNKTYLISDSINLASGIIVNIKGTLDYSGEDFAINMTNNSRNDIYIKNLLAPNGGGILMNPKDTSSMVWFNKINLINATCSGNVLKMYGNKRFISNNVFEGATWNSTTSTTIYIHVPSGSESESWVTENIFNHINLIADKTTRRSITILNENDKDIELRLNDIDFEDGFGIATTGYVGHISMIDCRLDEIYNKDGWLSFTNRVPSHIEIIGDGNLHPSRFSFTDIASIDLHKKFLYTNCTMYDFDTDSTINGGWVSSTTIYPDQFNNSTQKDLTNLTEYTFAPSLSGGLWTGFKTYATSPLSVTIPTSLFNAIKQRFVTAYFISNNTVTINIGTETRTFSVNAYEWYQIYYISGQIKLVKYS